MREPHRSTRDTVPIDSPDADSAATGAQPAEGRLDAESSEQAGRDWAGRELILASQSPRRRQLLAEAGYRFRVVVPHEHAECGICSRETPPELVTRLAYQKARDVAERVESGLVIGCDTVAECLGQILGKPKNRAHAREMLRFLRGQRHRVYSGLCLWQRPDNVMRLGVAMSVLEMRELSDEELESYLETGQWEGKAGAFGLQDRTGWIEVREGSESNVVGLPLELLVSLLSGAVAP
jgi:septum formation protein